MKHRALPQTLKAFLLLAVVLGLCMPPGAFASDAREGDGDELRVMSFNIRYGTANDGANRWENRRELVFDVLREHDCDVVGLQEALRFQIDEMREAVPVYGEIGVGRDDGKTRGEYCGILYRTDRLTVTDSGTFWLSDTPEIPGSITWGNACTRICTWGRFVRKGSGQAFYHFNVHLDHRSQPSREKSAVLLARRIRDRKHDDPVIVTGDFNAGESNPAVRYLKRDLRVEDADPAESPVPLVDSFRVLYPEATDVGTFNGFKGTRSGEKIDYIFTLPGVKVAAAEILRDNNDGQYPSDHFPVMARLTLSRRR
ncbi:MAG: endonuclease/exonuclease/phosphatase family protein [Sedimentisphaerales bacterium]|nr:endonuclease/exonuclease/phosphatase family protein [Sedimentisphaerales bacterium]